ncbi:hypothetical protein GCM10027040_27400 [Halomonas shantousis]
MQFTISINQAKALEWGLNAQQSLLFAFVYECPSWAKPVTTDDGVFYALSKTKIIEELPLLTDKPDTAYRMLRALKSAGLIELSNTQSITLVRLTAKGKTWNKKLDGSEKYPSGGRKKIRTGSEKNPSSHGKISEPGSEKSPTNQDTSNQGTNQDTSNQVAAGAEPQPLTLDGLEASNDETADELARIPADLPGPKDPHAKTFKPWANYAVAYRQRYGVYPIWNQRTAGQLSQLVDRVGKELAPAVAVYYLRMNNQFYVAKGHGVGLLLQDCEGIATQMQTGSQMTATRARQMDSTQTNLGHIESAKALIDATWED